MKPATITEISAAKAALRRAARENRALLQAGAGAHAANAATAHFLARVPRRPGDIVALYAPLGSEFDPSRLLARLLDAGHRCALPVIGEPAAPLRFRAWRPGEPLVAGRHGILEPGPGADEVLPDMIVVPCLAFDRAGYRLGYGAGYYDRTLAARRLSGGRPVGSALLAYAGQEVAHVPTDPHDQPVDWIVTEDFAIPSGMHA